MNSGPIYVGKDSDHSGVECYIDELKILNTVLKCTQFFNYFFFWKKNKILILEKEIIALSSFALVPYSEGF